MFGNNCQQLSEVMSELDLAYKVVGCSIAVVLLAPGVLSGESTDGGGSNIGDWGELGVNHRVSNFNM